MLVEKFTPEVLISAPRRGPAIPNHDGTLALYTVSTHTIGGDTLKEIRVMNIATGESSQLFDDEKAQDATWLGDGTNTVILLKKGGEGFTWLLTIDADKTPSSPLIVGHIQAPVRNLKVKALKDGTVAFAVVGLANADGELFNGEVKKPAHTGRVYDVYRAREVRISNLVTAQLLRYNTRGILRRELTMRDSGMHIEIFRNIPSSTQPCRKRKKGGRLRGRFTMPLPTPNLRRPLACTSLWTPEIITIYRK